MSINKVDYIPNQSFSNSTNANNEHEIKKLQKQKWLVLFGIFIIVSLLANLWIWTQPPVFKSQAILHFSFPPETEVEFNGLAQLKVQTYEQKLLSNSLMHKVFETLEQDIGYAVESLNKKELLTAEATGRLITLTARHQSADILEPVLAIWIKEYLELEALDKQKNNSAELDSSNLQLQAIEEKIAAKERQLSLFAEENDITSLERDENRVLNKIKALSANLDLAIAEQTSAQALFNSLQESIKKGQQIIRDVDKAQINTTQQNLQLLRSELTALEEKYTQAYLSRDPVIVRKQQSLIALEESLAEQLRNSQSYYLQDAERDLAAAKDKVIQTQEQFKLQNELAQEFNQKLQRYKGLSNELAAIQEQAQSIRNQLVKQEVSQPFDANISVLEHPYVPDEPSGPDYWYMTILSLLAATAASVFALLLFGYIVKQKQPNGVSTNFVVMPGQTMQGAYDQLSNEQQARLSKKQSSLLLAEQSLATEGYQSSQRFLSEQESQALYKVANKQGKVFLSLVFTGLDLTEISHLTKNNFSNNYNTLDIMGENPRTLSLNQCYQTVFKEVCETKETTDTLWSNLSSIEDFTQIVVNAAHDAELNFPEQINIYVLRHTYITFLVEQGARLNDLEQVVGYISPSELAQYRSAKRHGPSKDIVDLDLSYPLVV